jgi:hypothetical protein
VSKLPAAGRTAPKDSGVGATRPNFAGIECREVATAEHIDVIVSRSLPVLDGTRVDFTGLRTVVSSLELLAWMCIPAVADLIPVKQVGERSRHLEDIRLRWILSEESE